MVPHCTPAVSETSPSNVQTRHICSAGNGPTIRMRKFAGITGHCAFVKAQMVKLESTQTINTAVTMVRIVLPRLENKFSCTHRCQDGGAVLLFPTEASAI